ncbi:hypothetical protein V8E53_015006 [Lactarius tabidus]
MEDQYPSLPQDSGNLPVQVEDHPIHPTAMLEAPNPWDPCLPDSPWWQYLAHVCRQETPSIVSDAIDPRTVWAQNVNRPTARSPVLSRSQNPEMLPLTSASGNFDGSLGNQAGIIPDFHIRSGYNQEATFSYLGPERQSRFLATSTLVKDHSKSGKNKTMLDKIQNQHLHGTLGTVPRHSGERIDVPIATKCIDDPKT